MILVLRLSKTDANLATQMFDIVLSITVVSVNSLASDVLQPKDTSLLSIA